MDTFVYFVINLPSAKILIVLISNVINLAHFPKNLRILTKVCNVYSKKTGFLSKLGQVCARRGLCLELSLKQRGQFGDQILEETSEFYFGGVRSAENNFSGGPV